MLWKVTDDWMDKEIKAKGISMEKRRDFAWDLITEYVAHDIAKHFEVSDHVIEKRLIRENLWPPATNREGNNK